MATFSFISEVKNVWSHTSTPRTYINDVGKDKFIFTFTPHTRAGVGQPSNRDFTPGKGTQRPDRLCVLPSLSILHRWHILTVKFGRCLNLISTF